MKLKKLFFLLILLVITYLLAKSFYLSLNNTDIPMPTPTLRSHIFVNDQLYWSSAYPTDNTFLEGNFSVIGIVQTEVFYTPTINFQAYGVKEGSKIYYDNQFPQLLYVETSTALYRYATIDASKDYLYHDGITYVSLASMCSWDYECYNNNYIHLYGEHINTNTLPNNVKYIGQTKFVGYNMFVFNELESNSFQNSASVYQNPDNPNLLYVGNNKMIYVPLDKNQ